MGKAGDQRFAVTWLEFLQYRTIHHPGDDLAHVYRHAGIDGGECVQLARIKQRRAGRATRHGGRGGQGGHDAAGNGQRILVIFGEVIGDAGNARVHITAAQILGGHFLAGGGLHQWRPAEEDRALVFHDDRFIRHRRHIGATRGATAQHGGDLRDAIGAHVGLIEEDTAEMIAIGEHLVLPGQVGAAAIDQVKAGQAILRGDFLGAQMLLNGDRIVTAALHRGIVGHDHAQPAFNLAHPGNQAGGGHVFAINIVSSELADFKESAVWIEQRLHAFARQQLAARHVFFARRRRPTKGNARGLFAQFSDQFGHGSSRGAG